ncbi:COP9 signalosome complex subunit 1 isoform X1 [Syngnathus acus]|uniref:COP9 signalosome complex subunit 1 isoform X1 n=1 Tax=Syngnathus acus TaxID=161584 RepID=UPI001885DD5B|nr:COP9 signalosome complex subunit 1 isoform X1 [Syngnathus acus]
MPLPVQVFNFQGAVEPMQIDADPQEDQQNAPDINYIVENPTLDLEQYATSYGGLMRIERLQFIAEHCPQLRVESLKMALTFVQRTFNVDTYEEVHRKLSDASREVPGVPEVAPEGGVVPPPLDSAWAESTRKKALLKLEKLDTDLKNYKGNSIKESIRRGHDDLGDHYLDCGDLSNALKCYSRARDYCTSAKHVINMCLNVIKVSVYLQNWSHVLSYVNKAESTPEIAEQRGERDSQNQAVLTKLKCAAGLAELASRKYKAAAKCFLQASFDHCDCPEVSQGSLRPYYSACIKNGRRLYNARMSLQLLSPSNVAVYGGLCALATFDRQELQRNVISSSSFKLFLELEPQIRDIIFKFYESKYASCLKLLDEMKDNLLLDMYLAPHVRTLYSQIRNRALIQYFSPYVSADMTKMAQAFNTTVAALEDELTQLILEGLINARIDSHSKILYARDVDQRSTTFEKSLHMGKEFQRRAKAMILRAAVLRNQIHVKSPPREGSQGELTPANSQTRMSTNM